MAKLDPRIEAIRDTYGLTREDVWELPQRPGTWIVKHAALETVAAKAELTFYPPTIIEAATKDGIAVLVVTGRTKDGREEWSTGECSPANYKTSPKQPGYPWAMAEKRAKDRVILKLLGVHGLIYSEDEADFTESKANGRARFKEIVEELKKAESLAGLQMMWRDYYAEIQTFKDDWKTELTKIKDDLKHDFEEKAEKEPA